MIYLDLAAALVHSLARNRALVDGNERLALTAPDGTDRLRPGWPSRTCRSLGGRSVLRCGGAPFQLRHNVSGYDAAYIALAEALR